MATPGSSAAAATVTPFSSPPQTTNAGGAASQAGAVAQATGTSSSAGVQSTLSQVVSTVPNTLQGLASPMSAAGTNPVCARIEYGHDGDLRIAELPERTEWIGCGELLELHDGERVPLG